MSRIYSSLTQLPESPRTLPVLLSFATLLMGALFILRLKADLNYDGEIYIAAATKFAGGMFREGVSVYPMPVYPLLIALTHAMLPDWVLAGRLISLISMILLVIPMYLLTKDLFSRRAAFWSCGVFILLPETLVQSNSVLRDPLFCLLFMTATYFAHKALQSKEINDLLWLALFASLSTFFRLEGLIFFPICFCAFTGLAAFKADERKHYIRFTVTWVVIWLLLITSFFFSASALGLEKINRFNEWEFFYSGFKNLSLFENYHRITEQLIQIRDSSTQRDVGQHVAEVLRTLMPLIYVLGLLQMLSATILPLNFVILVWGITQADYNAKHLLVMALAAGLMLLAGAYFVRMEIILKRYLIMPGLLLIPWIGFGIDRFFFTIVQRLPLKRWAGGCIVILVFALPATGFNHFFINKDDLASRTGIWIANHAEFNSSKIVFNDQIVKFHTDMEREKQGLGNTMLYLFPIDKDFSRLERYAKDNHVDMIVFQNRVDEHNAEGESAAYKKIKEFSYKNKIIKIYVIDTGKGK
jgi:hypothetical protein